MRTVADAIKVAVAASDTTEKSLGTLETPQGFKRITGLWCTALQGPGLTTLEGNGGVYRIDSADNVLIKPMTLPLHMTQTLTSGSIALNQQIIPVDIPCKGGVKLECLVTMAMAQTVANVCTWGYIGEAD